MNQTQQKILEIFQGFRMPVMPNDQYEDKGKAILGDKLMPFINADMPIQFVMLGFPMKSPNDRDKVIGKMPDLAEEVAMKNFADFNEKVKAIYAPGVEIKVISDGYIFSDLMEVPDHTVFEYGQICADMARGTSVEMLDVTHFYSKYLPMSVIRERINQQFGITDLELERRILMDPDVTTLYRGMIKFMTGDLAIRNFSSNNQLQKQAKKVAKEMMFRNEAYSRMVQSEFGNTHIRLSMHHSINNGTKYSFQLINSPKAYTSPWHCALAIDRDGVFETIHRKDAEAQGYELVSKDGRPYYFQQH